MSVVTKIHRGVQHLRNGTLISHIATRWRKARGWHRDVEVEPGVSLRLYYDSELANWIATGTFEVEERQFVGSYLRAGDVFVDVGANIGLFTLIAASRVGRTGRVYAFEPCATTFRRLQENVNLAGADQVVTSRLALSDRVETREMTVSADGFDAWNSLAKPFAGNAFGSESIECVTWDGFATRENLRGRVALMKIDVEGWETRVLDGGIETLSRADAPDLLVEFADQTANLAGTSCAALYDGIVGLGYRAFVYNASTKGIEPHGPQSTYEYLNVIATKDPDRVAARICSGVVN